MDATNASYTKNNTSSGVNVHKMFSYHGFPVSFVIFMIIALSVTLVLSITGNSLIIIAIYRNINGKMRSTRNLLILNMAISDLVSSVFNIPDQMRWLFLGYQVIIDGKFGVTLCVLKDFVNTLAIDVSLFSLGFITIDRYLGIFFPMKKYFTRRRIWYIIALSWALPTVYYSPKFAIFQIIDFSGQRSCYMHTLRVFSSIESYLVFMLAHFIIFQVLPVLLMLVLYPSIAFKLWCRKIPGITHERTRARNVANNKKITKMFVIIILSSVFCYAPLYTYFYDCFYGKPIAICEWKYANYFMAITSLLFFIPLFINCFIYVKFCESFRKAFKDIIRTFCGSMGVCFGKNFLQSRSVYEMSSFGATSARRRRLGSEDLRVTLGTTGTVNVNQAFHPRMNEYHR